MRRKDLVTLPRLRIFREQQSVRPLLQETIDGARTQILLAAKMMGETNVRKTSAIDSTAVQANKNEIIVGSGSGSVKINYLTNGTSTENEAEESSRPSMESNSSNPMKQSIESGHGTEKPNAMDTKNLILLEGPNSSQTATDIPGEDMPGRPHHNTTDISDLQRQEEFHAYIERIDALQAKLQYLSRESAESARKAAAAAPPSSTERTLAEKDEQIALLMEEGQKLSKTELKHMTVIKKLRTKVTETEKEVVDAKRKLEKAEKEKLSLSERLKWIETAERQSAERQKILTQLQKEMEAIIADRDAKKVAIMQLEAQLMDSKSQATATEIKAVEDLLVAERRRAADLENDISTLKIEKELAAAKAKAQVEELRSKLERETERARVVEVEMKAEQQMLERRLEIMRTRAEEVSSGATSDAQAKLLRQIETLQTQYAVASENWQGIEASLTARATSLEKERDEALRREAEIRRKAREAVSKANS